MAFSIGDRVIYKDGSGKNLKGEIVDIWRDNKERVGSYFVVTDSGLYVQFLSHNQKWNKIQEPILVA